MAQDQEEPILRSRASNRTRLISILFLLVGTIFTATGTIAKLYLESSGNYLDSYYKNIETFYTLSLGGGVTTLLFGVALFSALYLGLFTQKEDKDTQLLERISALSAELNYLNKKIERVSENKSDPAIRKEYERSFHETFKDKFNEKFLSTAKDFIRDAALEEYAPQIFKQEAFKIIEKAGGDFISGIHREINVQQRNANFNVWFGMIFSLLGLGVMGVVVLNLFGNFPGSKDWSDFTLAFIPKLLFVIIFESIAFFFFRAYREDRAMVRYLRNESTNVESRLLAASLSVLFGDDKSNTYAVKSLLETERNFILKKGDRTIIESLNKDNHFFIEKIAEEVVSKIKVGKATTDLRGGTPPNEEKILL